MVDPGDMTDPSLSTDAAPSSDNHAVDNLDARTVEGFGVEWSRFDQSTLSESELQGYFDAYFEIFPWNILPPNAVGVDVGCGSGRWAKFVAKRVGRLHCVDASADALAVARRNLSAQGNCVFHHTSAANIDLPDRSLDFGYSLGVLHHVPDTAGALQACAAKLKPGAPFLVYLYYAFDNRPKWFQLLWTVSDHARRLVSQFPDKARVLTADFIAGTVYFPLARLSALAEKIGLSVDLLPLAYYRHSSFYTMRTDALDRFGTSLEQRFSKDQIREMLINAGFERISFREGTPYWCAVGYKRTAD